MVGWSWYLHLNQRLQMLTRVEVSSQTLEPAPHSTKRRAQVASVHQQSIARNHRSTQINTMKIGKSTIANNKQDRTYNQR